MVSSLTIAALSIMKVIAESYKPGIANQVYYYDKPQKEPLGQKLFGKFFLCLPNQKSKPIYALLDSGADLSLISLNFLTKLLSESEITKYKRETKFQLESFSNHDVPIIYDIDLPFKTHVHGVLHTLSFSVYTEIGNYPLLVGSNLMEQLGMILSYGSKPRAELANHSNSDFKSLYTHPSNAMTCSAYLTLEPNETKPITFIPHPLCYIQPGETVLISEASHPDILIIPTRYKAYTTRSHPFMASVTNLAQSPFKGKVHAIIETLDDTLFLNKETAEEDFKQIQSLQNELLNPHQKFKHLNAFRLLQTLPSFNTNKTGHLSADLLKTPYQSKQTTSNTLNQSQAHPQLIETSNETLTEEDTILRKELLAIDPGWNQPEEPPDPGEDMPEELIQPAGYEIPCNLHATLEDIIDLNKFEEPHRQHIERIFYKKYPKLISTHPYDIGQISKTMGYYTIELKENTTLPTFRKMYYLSPGEGQQMRDICNFLLRYKIIERCSHQHEFRHLSASPGYLLAKSNPLASARLIIDYTLLNQCIKTAAPTIPNIQSTLQELRGYGMFTTSDLTSAFYSVEIDPKCRYLTRFIVNEGSFLLRKLPMGLVNSPFVFSEIAFRLIHMRPKLDVKGNPIFVKPNVVELEPDRIPGVHIFYDDLLIATPPYSTYAETVDQHYKLVDKIMGRLNFHSAKISFEKSKFGRTSIQFLGWNIQYNQLHPDQKRISKLLATPFPTNLKAIRSFLGLFQTISLCCPKVIMKELAVLNPLSSSTTPYNPQPHHKEAFEKLKILLTSTPLYSNLVDPNAKKVLFVDASDKGNYAAVLGQLQHSNDSPYIPDHLILDDPVDRIIFDHQLCYKSVPLYLHDKYIPRSLLQPPYQLLPVKEPSYLQSTLLGYPENKAQNSFFISLRSIQYAYGCQLSDEMDIRKQVGEKLKKSIMKFRLMTDCFENNKQKYEDFIHSFLHNQGSVDDKFYIIDLISDILHRPFILISTLPHHKGKEFFKFTQSSTKPPFVFGVYQKETQIIFRPYFVDKNSSFDLKELQNKFQIVAFWTKAISKADKIKSILDKELYAILGALNALSSLIGKSEILCLTDSKGLFLLYSNPVTKSSSKLCRWGAKLATDWSNLSLRFIKTGQNLADFLTRDLNIQHTDFQRLPLDGYQVPDLLNHIDENKDYTIAEWKCFVEQNQHLLKYDQQDKKAVSIMSLNKTAENIRKLINPVKILEDKLSHENIAKLQKAEYKNIVETLISQPNMQAELQNSTYKLLYGLLYIQHENVFKIMLPYLLEGSLMAYTHLSLNHAGYEKMNAALFPFYFANKSGKIRHLTSRCFACALQNTNTKKHVLGTFTIPEYPFQTICLDLLENLPSNNGYSHVLIIVCPLTNFLLTYPLKSKKSNMVVFHFLYNMSNIF